MSGSPLGNDGDNISEPNSGRSVFRLSNPLILRNKWHLPHPFWSVLASPFCQPFVDELLTDVNTILFLQPPKGKLWFRNIPPVALAPHI